MSLENYKITQGDIETKGVVAAPDVLSGGAQKNKAIFDRLIREAVAVQFNALVDALTASSGAGEIGAAVDGIAAGTVLGVLSALKVLHDTTEQTQGATNESVQAALGNRYTKDQTDALLQGKLDTVTANQMVRAIEFNAETGVFTITTQGGAVSTIDTMLERVPASFALENNQLVLTLEDGTRQTADLSAFIDTYTFSSGGTVVFSQNGKTVTAEVRDGSLALSKLTPEAQATLASYANRAEAAKEGAEAARAGAEAARDAAQRAAATAEEKASAAAGSASTAGNHASNAAGSAGAAKESETNAKDSETAAKAAQAAAEQARDEAQAVAGGDFLPLAGGTLTGKLTLDGAPETDLHAATKKYVDDAVGNIPTPDVSGQINTHNTDTSAHADIRNNMMSKATYDPQGKAQDVFAYAKNQADEVQAKLSTHIGDKVIHITADERTAWNGKENGGAAAAVQTNLNTHANNTTIHVTATEKSEWNGKAAKSNVVNITLAASGWADNVYIVTMDGVTATSNQEVLPAVNITAEQLDALQAANIQDGGQTAGNITLKAYGEVPTIDIPIRVIKRGD